MIIQIIDYLKAHSGAVKLCTWVGLTTIIVWSVSGVDTHHAHTWMEKHIPGFWALFGIISCVILVYFSRWFGKSGIMTREDYYDN